MISSFSIQPISGKLKHIGDSFINESLAYITIDQAGKYLLGASFPQHNITVNAISSTGSILTQQQALFKYPNAHAIVVDKSNKYIFVPTFGSNKISQFIFDSGTGKLTPNSPAFIQLEDNIGPRHMTIHPNGQFAYVIGEHDATIHVFTIDPNTGLLKAKQSINTLPSSYNGRRAAADIHITPDGKFIYSSERGSSTISAFNISAKTGLLTIIVTIETEESPRGFNIAPSGKHLFVVGQHSNHIASYTIDELTGKLSLVARAPVGDKPNWIEVVHLP